MVDTFFSKRWSKFVDRFSEKPAADFKSYSAGKLQYLMEIPPPNVDRFTKHFYTFRVEA